MNFMAPFALRAEGTATIQSNGHPRRTDSPLDGNSWIHGEEEISTATATFDSQGGSE